VSLRAARKVCFRKVAKALL